MNESKKKLRAAQNLLRDDRTDEAEKRSLALSLAALRRRKHQRRLFRWGLSTAAVAASLLVAVLLFQNSAPPEVTREEPEPAVRSLTVRTRSLAEGVTVRSRHSAEFIIATRALPANSIAQTDRSRSAVTVVNTAPSDRIEFLTEQQLLAALEGHPLMLTKARDGERRLTFLDEKDRQMLWEP